MALLDKHGNHILSQGLCGEARSRVWTLLDRQFDDAVVDSSSLDLVVGAT